MGSEDRARRCKLSCNDSVLYGEDRQRIDRRFGAQRGRAEMCEAAVAVMIVIRMIEIGLIVVVMIVVVFVVVVVLVDDRTVDVDVVVVVPDEMERRDRDESAEGCGQAEEACAFDPTHPCPPVRP